LKSDSYTRHWLGLQHTAGFEFSCDKTDDDLIEDTPIQFSSGFQCDAPQDSCPDDEGLDPIHNFMDLTVDACRYEWTSDQIEVMRETIEAYRSRDLEELLPVAITLGARSGPFSLAQRQRREFTLTIPEESGEIKCVTAASAGDVDMAVSIGPFSSSFDCLSWNIGDSFETCVLSPDGSTELLILVEAAFATLDFTLICFVISTNELTTLLPSVADSLTLNAGTTQPYRLDIPDDGMVYTRVECRTRGMEGDVSLLLSDFDDRNFPNCRSETPFSSNETCAQDVLSFTDEIFVWVEALEDSTMLTVTCDLVAFEATPLQDGMASDLFVIATDQRTFFSLTLMSVAPVECRVSVPSSDNGIFIRLDMVWNDETFPLSSTVICTDFAADLSCLLPTDSGTAYMSIAAFDASIPDATITCTVQD